MDDSGKKRHIRLLTSVIQNDSCVQLDDNELYSALIISAGIREVCEQERKRRKNSAIEEASKLLTTTASSSPSAH